MQDNMDLYKILQVLIIYSYVSYPNHSLKQNRNYQVGLVLQDRYGRSSDVILSNTLDANYTLGTGGTSTTFEDNPITFGGSTIYHPYATTATSAKHTQHLSLIHI